MGGMGAVYRARDLHFPNVVKRVAVKEMITTVRESTVRETMLRNFEREANLLATLEHPAIPRIYDYFTHNDRSYLILEFIEGKDLEALMVETQGFFPMEKVVSWAIELCDVLQYLHTHTPEPIIFRDLKPSNVMIDQRGHIVLVDFGIAKTLQPGMKGTMIGTEGYSPPEQYKGEAGPLSDIYSLGATLHHLLTRRDPRLEVPFSFTERPIRQLNPSCSIELETVVMTALQYSPANRFQSAAAMKDVLLAVARKTGMLASIRAHTEGFKIEDTSKLIWKFECEDEIRGTPVIQDDTLFVGSYDHNLYAINARDGEFIWKYATDGGVVTKPAFSDGNIYFGSEDRRLHVISQRSGKLAWTYYTDGPVRSSPTIAESHVFFGSDDNCVHAINSLSGRRAWKMDSGSPIRSTPAVVNERVFFGNENGEFTALDLTGNIKWRFKAKRGITSSPLVSNNVVYFGSLDATVCAIDAKTGFVIWRFRLPKGTISSPAIVENFLMIGCADYNFYCIDAQSSKELWRFPTEHQIAGTPVICRDAVVFGSVDKNIYCLEYRTGRLRWKMPTGGAITGGIAFWQDMIFAGSTDHFIYALSI